MAVDEEYESPLLARYRPLAHTTITAHRPNLPNLEVRLDPICSRSCITRWTLGMHFPAQTDETFPNRPPSRSMFDGSSPVKGYDCVTILLELQAVEGKRVEIEVQLRICENSEGSKVLDGKIVLGMDFWGRDDVVVSWPAVSRKEEAGRGWFRNTDEGEEFLGMEVEEQKVKFEKVAKAKI